MLLKAERQRERDVSSLGTAPKRTVTSAAAASTAPGQRRCDGANSRSTPSNDLDGHHSHGGRESEE